MRRDVCSEDMCVWLVGDLLDEDSREPVEVNYGPLCVRGGEEGSEGLVIGDLVVRIHWISWHGDGDTERWGVTFQFFHRDKVVGNECHLDGLQDKSRIGLFDFLINGAGQEQSEQGDEGWDCSS